jgi:hypothetical protein
MPQPPAKDPFAFDRAKINRGQKAVMSPVLKIVLALAGGVFLLCAGVFGFAFLSGVYQGFQQAQERARNAPPVGSDGEAAFRAANMQITSHGSDGKSAWGNTEEARRLAADFSTKIKALREVYFTKRKKEPIVSLTDGEFLTYCHLDGRACVFLVHAPDLRKYTPEAKAGLADLAWATAQHVVRSDLKDPPPKLAIGTRGVMLYGHVLIGEFQPDEEADGDGVEVRESGGSPESRLYQFFSPNAVAQRPASIGPSTVGDMPADDKAEAKPEESEPDDAKPEEPQPEEGEPADDDAAPGPTEDQPGNAKSPDDAAAPGAAKGTIEAVESPDEKAAPGSKNRERPPIGGPRASSKRESRMAESKKRSDDFKKRNNDLKKQTDETVAASQLRLAETYRKSGDLKTYRKRLKEIVDKYPDTEAGKKAAKSLD